MPTARQGSVLSDAIILASTPDPIHLTRLTPSARLVASLACREGHADCIPCLHHLQPGSSCTLPATCINPFVLKARTASGPAGMHGSTLKPKAYTFTLIQGLIVS